MAEIKVPVFPESIAEGTIASWHKNKGDRVEEGEVIAEIETDKVVMEVPATESGVLSEIKKEEGDNVTSEEVIGVLSEAEDTSSAQGADDEKKAEKSQDSNADVADDANTDESSAKKDDNAGKVVVVDAPSFPESVAEGTLASWHKKVGDEVQEGETIVEIETDKVMMEVPAPVTGVLSKMIKNEGDTIISSEAVAEITQGATADTKSTKKENQEDQQKDKLPNDNLSPSVRRAVGSQDVDVSKVQGSGKKGRITKQDVTGTSKQESSKKADADETAFSGDRPEKRVRMTRLRQTIAKRLVEVQHTNAILTTFNEVDMKPVMDLRKQYKELFQKTHDAKLGFMSFFLKAATEALKRYPEVNASIDGDDVVYHGFFDIGVAVGSDRGLVVPVIRDTDQKSFAKIESDIVQKAIKARDGKLSLEEMQGGTFTITNGGTYGSMLSTPIINAPQSAILGMHNIVERPVVVDGDIVIRPMMYLALSYDHRIIDGSVSVKFLKTIKELIEDPARMLLEV
ncbi:2-oxoglutarate dehydrogenase complex dihydrolipoyllysine-residue succinyltransferase [Facilibium subflavum]|uniref:2-oxoglutarate dehydrogenase complex dihydrolipoyllysine-residue succinyltransferase n=1 Tax=Facilibium subflavum TaxID=2219058 RepID=UPI000E64DDFD|nr:2-oxoglutarate dehydrogenase complex dihydrolipoyllysine-residue succinyltransferase [Facilibium subflavum]